MVIHVLLSFQRVMHKVFMLPLYTPTKALQCIDVLHCYFFHGNITVFQLGQVTNELQVWKTFS